jgi:hypothetical protein
MPSTGSFAPFVMLGASASAESMFEATNFPRHSIAALVPNRILQNNDISRTCLEISVL